MNQQDNNVTKDQRHVADSIESLPLSMVISDPHLPDCPIVYVNEAFQRTTLYSREYALGRNCRFLRGEETDPEAVKTLSEALKRGEDVSVDLLNYKADGTPFVNRLLIAPIRDDHGNLESFLGIQREMRTDELPADRDELNASEPAAMLKELQHRVKNHLAMIVSMIRVQAEKKVTRESFEALSHRIGSLSLLYDELSTAGVGRHGDETIPAGAYLSRVAAAMTSLDARRGIRITVECEEIPLPVEVTARLGLLLTEFLTNALEHAFPDQPQGLIRVRFQQLTGGGVQLLVEDDGVGLPADSTWPWGAESIEAQTEHVEKNEDTHTGKTGGVSSGLGGSIVLALVQSLRADLSVTSPGRGTFITLQISDQDKTKLPSS